MFSDHLYYLHIMGCFLSKSNIRVQSKRDHPLMEKLTANKITTNGIQGTIDSTPISDLNYIGLQKSINLDYRILNTLGSGHLSRVSKAASVADENFQVAIKSINKLKISRNLRYLFKEIENLRQADHPNIIKFYATYEDEKYIHIVTELCEGDELFDRIQRKGYYPENQAASIFFKILRCINYLHNIGICHRDIKPENFMFESSCEDADIKLIDFGFSTKFLEEDEIRQMKSTVGSPRYLAPEVLEGKYGPKCDMWSLGVLLYVMLSGRFPFSGHTHQEIFWNIQVGKVNFKSKVWLKVSQEAQDLIKKLLTTDPSIRLGAKEALHHPWVNQAKSYDVRKLDSSVIQSLKVQKKMNDLNKEFLVSSVRYIPESNLKNLKVIFNRLDVLNDGYITTNSLQKLSRNSELELNSEELKQIFDSCQLHRSDRIYYSEFITAELLPNMDNMKECLLQAFRYFSGDSEHITVSNVYTGLLGLGKNYTFDNVLSMIKELFPSSIGGITYRQFEEVMLSK